MSLRARLIVGLLALATVGLIALAAITYAEQRDFLYERVDQQARAAVPRSARPGGPGGAPDARRLRPRVPGGPGDGDGDHGPRGLTGGTWIGAAHRGGHDHRQLRLVLLDDDGLAPDLPANLPTDHLITVKDTESSTRYRVAARRRSADGGLTIVAVPLTETDQTLHRLLLVEGLVIAAILLALGALSWWLVRIGLRPLDRMGVTAGAIAGGDLSHRVDETHAEDRGRAAGPGAQRDARPARARRSPSARPARTGCAASSPTPRTSCARRWRRSAATPSCSASARRATPRTPRRR